MSNSLLRISTLMILLVKVFPFTGQAQSGKQSPHSIARTWIEVMIDAMREDYVRPPVNARSLFYASVGMYDAWAAYDPSAQPYFLGKGEWPFKAKDMIKPADKEAARREAISYVMYRYLSVRFSTSPNYVKSQKRFDDLMRKLGYDINNLNTNYLSGSAAALGNYIFWCVYTNSLADGAAEDNDFEKYYLPKEYKNSKLSIGGKQFAPIQMNDPNCWQPLMFWNHAIDQNGNRILDLQNFEGAHWGSVTPFALNSRDRKELRRDDKLYALYFDVPEPPRLDINSRQQTRDYQWNFGLVAAWSKQLDPFDGVQWDVSPAALGNVGDLPKNTEGVKQFYDFEKGWTKRDGYILNPKTGKPYAAQVVARGNFLRAMAQYWSDGPKSETPPGHWYSLLNYINEQPETSKKWNGKGRTMDALEWDVRCYLTLGGALHDAAIAAWAYKGWYFSVRPISAIRYMASLGQSTDSTQLSYHPFGLPLRAGFVELIAEGDSLAGANGENVGKIKVNTWRGHLTDTAKGAAGSGWILAENWFPFLKNNFVTPPFPGYLSGHSCFSQASAEAIALIMGDAYFPRGLGEYTLKKGHTFFDGEKLTEDVTLQWATYYDAADQCGLSRIYSGIHPPCDDLWGRVIGRKIGKMAFEKANAFFK